jgi:hypothetical protein
MDDPADLSSQDGPGWHVLDGCVSTRNRKVVGSNPTSGSITAGQRVCARLLPLALLASLIIPVREVGLQSLPGEPRCWRNHSQAAPLAASKSFT